MKHHKPPNKWSRPQTHGNPAMIWQFPSTVTPVAHTLQVQPVTTCYRRRWTREQLGCRRRKLPTLVAPTPRPRFPCHATSVAVPNASTTHPACCEHTRLTRIKEALQQIMSFYATELKQNVKISTGFFLQSRKLNVTINIFYTQYLMPN